MQRRDFLRFSGAMAIGGFSFVELPFGKTGPAQTVSNSSGSKKLRSIGVQLYTVRNLMYYDFEGSISKVAQLGYTEVEFAGYFNRKPLQVKKLLDQLGLSAPSTHIGLQQLEENLDEVIDDSATIGHKFIICPWIPENRRTLNSYKGLAEFFNHAGEVCKKSDIRFGYHNHSFEFETVDGEVPFDILLSDTEPGLVDIEIDFFWFRDGGKNPLDYFAQYPGRFKLCHVKDMDASGKMATVGKGVIDFASIFAKSEQAGLDYFFVEHDHPEDPLKSISTSKRYLENLTFG